MRDLVNKVKWAWHLRGDERGETNLIAERALAKRMARGYTGTVAPEVGASCSSLSNLIRSNFKEANRRITRTHWQFANKAGFVVAG